MLNQKGKIKNNMDRGERISGFFRELLWKNIVGEQGISTLVQKEEQLAFHPSRNTC